MSYAQARKDHEYLWETYGAALDMTGGYVDQHDLWRLLKKPTKNTAAYCYQNQIEHWFSVGPEQGTPEGWQTDPRVFEIAERYMMVDEYRHIGGKL